MTLFIKCLHRWILVMSKLFWISINPVAKISVQDIAMRNRVEDRMSSEADWRNTAIGQGKGCCSWKRQGPASALESQSECGHFHTLDLDSLLQVESECI